MVNPRRKSNNDDRFSRTASRPEVPRLTIETRVFSFPFFSNWRIKVWHASAFAFFRRGAARGNCCFALITWRRLLFFPTPGNAREELEILRERRGRGSWTKVKVILPARKEFLEKPRYGFSSRSLVQILAVNIVSSRRDSPVKNFPSFGISISSKRKVNRTRVESELVAALSTSPLLVSPVGI